ncbi:MAG TPA: PLDc N-terminal domain-containing protein [Actinotalea sp.]
MIRLLPAWLEVIVLVFCLIDAIQADTTQVRNMKKVYWIILIIVVPVIGGIAWLVAGRPEAGAAQRRVPWPSTKTAGLPERQRPPRGPDDDEQFLADLRASDAQHEKMLAEWEKQLRERETRLRDDDSPGEPGGGAPGDGAPSDPDAPEDNARS